MKHHIIRSIAVILALVLSISVMGACQNMNTGTSDEKVAAVFEGEKISLTEAKLYAFMEQYEAEYQSGDYISSYYGDPMTYWTTDMGGITMEQYARQYVVARMLQTRVLLKYAETENITLTAEEQAHVDELIAAFPEKYAKVIELSGASDELIAKFMNNNALANKAYAQIISGIDTTLDPDAMLRKRANGVSLYASLYKPRENEEEDLVQFTSDERKANLTEVYDRVLQDINDGMSYEDVVEKYKDEENVSVSAINDFGVGASDAAEEGAEFTDYRQLAWTLGEGESGTMKLDYNGYFVTVTNADDPEYRANAETAEINSRKAAAFAEKIEALNKKYSRFHLYEDVYEETHFKEAVFEG